MDLKAAFILLGVPFSGRTSRRALGQKWIHFDIQIYKKIYDSFILFQNQHFNFIPTSYILIWSSFEARAWWCHTRCSRGIQLKLKEVQLLKCPPSKGLNLILSLEIVYPNKKKNQQRVHLYIVCQTSSVFIVIYFHQ